MKTLIFLALMLALMSPQIVEAQNNGKPNPVPPSSDIAVNGTVDGRVSSVNKATGTGLANAENGPIEIDNESQGGAGGEAKVVVSDRAPRQAPSVGLVVPQSDLMGCTKGFGWFGSHASGSSANATGLGWSWLQRDCYAFRRFEMLAGLGEKEAAAKAYCSRKMHYSDFGGKGKCETVIVQSLTDIETAREVAEIKKQIPSTSPVQRYLKSLNTKP